MEHQRLSRSSSVRPETVASLGTRSQQSRAPCPTWTIQICPTTGGNFELQTSPEDNIENLKRMVAKKLKTPKERLSLLYRERVLKEGSLRANGIFEGSRITLLPNVESGLMSQKPEHSVMQALENLTESQQVNDFLSGKSPLTLAMRLGDHMMFVQLQLSTSPPSSKRPTPGTSQKAVRPRSPPSSPSVFSQSTSRPSATNTTAPTSPRPPALFRHYHGAPLRPAALPQPIPHLSNQNKTSTKPVNFDSVPILDSSTLVEASRNLSQKLKELSQASAPHTASSPSKSKTEVSASSSKLGSPLKSTTTPGAIIESMHHHGQGVYSGTFSGTLNPALQDKDGKPKRSVGTIVHILNDLLGATPQYRAQLSPTSTRKPELRTDSKSPSTKHKFKTVREHIRMSQENRALRGKVEQIQSMLEERRQRRKARREARACPYATWNDDAEQDKQVGAVQANTSETHPMEVDANLETSNMATDSSQYTGLKQETVVA